MPVDPTSDRAVFRQIADDLRDRIRSGELSSGSRLPSEADLMADFGVARGTVRQALHLLQSEGLIAAQHGRGVFVRGAGPVIRLASKRLSRRNREAGFGGFAADMAAVGLESRQEILSLGQEPAPDHVAERLGLRKGSKVFARRRRMWGGDVPLQLASSYYRPSLVRGTAITQEDSGPGGSYARLEERGHKLARFMEELQARMPTSEERRMLHLDAGVPVVALIRTAFDDEDNALEVFDSLVVGDRHTFVYDFPAT